MPPYYVFRVMATIWTWHRISSPKVEDPTPRSITRSEVNGIESSSQANTVMSIASLKPFGTATLPVPLSRTHGSASSRISPSTCQGNLLQDVRMAGELSLLSVTHNTSPQIREIKEPVAIAIKTSSTDEIGDVAVSNSKHHGESIDMIAGPLLYDQICIIDDDQTHVPHDLSAADGTIHYNTGDDIWPHFSLHSLQLALWLRDGMIAGLLLARSRALTNGAQF